MCVCVCVCVCVCMCVGKRTKSGPKWQNILSHSYLRNCTSFWYTFVKWWYLQQFFSFFQNTDFFWVFQSSSINAKRKFLSVPHLCMCVIFVLMSNSLYTEFMLILILIYVHYSRKAVFSFEKGSNSQNHSSGSHHPVKTFPSPAKFLILPIP